MEDIENIPVEMQEQIETVEETLPPEALPPVVQTEEVDAVKDEEAIEVNTSSLSSQSFKAESLLRNLMTTMRESDMAGTFAMEIDEIDLFLGRTMHSITQKLA